MCGINHIYIYAGFNFLLTFQLILELCKGSVRGFVDSQAIQSLLDRFPINSANTDVSKMMEYPLKTKQMATNADNPSLTSDPICGSTGMQR